MNEKTKVHNIKYTESDGSWSQWEIYRYRDDVRLTRAAGAENRAASQVATTHMSVDEARMLFNEEILTNLGIQTIKLLDHAAPFGAFNDHQETT